MLAQGQSSSAKIGGLAADVSSGLIFLKKKGPFDYDLFEGAAVLNTMQAQHPFPLESDIDNDVKITILSQDSQLWKCSPRDPFSL